MEQTVYMVAYWYYDTFDIFGIFSSMEKAQYFIDHKKWNVGALPKKSEVSIEEFTLDKPIKG